MRSIVRPLLLAALLTATSCALLPSDSGGACEDDGDCSNSGKCTHGVCKGICPCEDGWECIETDGLFVDSSYCAKSCRTDQDCPASWHCNGACPAPFAEAQDGGSANYVCFAQDSLTCAPDRPLSGAILTDKDPRTALRSEPVTFTASLLHGGRGGSLKHLWTVNINDVDQPVMAAGDSLTVNPRQEYGTLRVSVQLTNDAGQETTLRYVTNFY